MQMVSLKREQERFLLSFMYLIFGEGLVKRFSVD